MSQVKIEMTGHGRGRVWVDGREMEHVRAVRFESEAHCANTVTLEFYADAVEIQALSDVIEQKSSKAE